MMGSYGAVAEAHRSTFARSTWFRWYFVTAIVCIVIGGGLAAATAYASTEKTAWATAYIVLVGGMAQGGLGAAVAWLRPAAPPRLAFDVWVLWNVGNIGVLVGQLAGAIVLTYVGTVLLVVGLALVLVAVGSRHYRGGAQYHRGVLVAFRSLVVLLAVTMPIGVVLASLKA